MKVRLRRQLLAGLLLVASVPLDRPIYEFLHASLTPVVSWVLRRASNPGDPRALAGLVAILLVYGLVARRSRFERAAVVLGTALGVAGIAVLTLKVLFNRGADGVFYGFWQGWTGGMFPSGHTAAAFTACVVIGGVWPRARWGAIAVASGVALSRVCLFHYLSDVIAGVMLGAGVGRCAVDIAARTAFLSLKSEGSGP